MGAWGYILQSLYKKVDIDLASRSSASSPATGYAKAHAAEQIALVEKAFTI